MRIFAVNDTIDCGSLRYQINRYVELSFLNPIFRTLGPDLGISLEYTDDADDIDIDIYVNYERETTNTYSKNSEPAIVRLNQEIFSITTIIFSVPAREMISIWPHYQQHYCIIYSNSHKVPAHEMITYTLGTFGYIMTIVPMYVSWAYHYLILRYR